MKNKIVRSAREAIKKIKPGSTVVVAGFLGVGIADELIQELANTNIRDLTLVSYGTGVLNPLLVSRCAKKMICTLPKNKLGLDTMPGTTSAVGQKSRGALEVEVCPQSVIVERINAGAAGIAAFYTPLGADTELAEGKEIREFNGVPHVLEHAIKADYAIIAADMADEYGNLVYLRSARCGNVEMAMNARTTIVQADRIVKVGELDPDSIVTSGAFVDIIYPTAKIKPRWRQRRDPNRDEIGNNVGPRIARDLPSNSIVEFGFGLPWFVFDHLPLDRGIMVHSEGVLGIEPTNEDDETEIRNANGDMVKFGPGGSTQTFDASFKLVNSGKVDVAVLGAFQVSATGDFASWKSNVNQKLPAVGASIELSTRSKKLYIIMKHLDNEGNSKIVPECTLPVTARSVVDRIYTDLCTLEVMPQGLKVLEIVGDLSHEELERLTGMSLLK